MTMWDPLIVSLRWVFTNPWSMYSSIPITVFWVLLFRCSLKFSPVKSALGIFLLERGILFINILVYEYGKDVLFMPEDFSYTFIHFFENYIYVAAEILVLTLFIREGWQKLALVYFMSSIALYIGEHALTHLSLLQRRVIVLSDLADQILSLAVIAVFMLLLYLPLAPRLRRVSSRDIKWLWLGVLLYEMVYTAVSPFFIHIYFDTHNIEFSMHDPVYMYVTLLFHFTSVLVLAFFMLMLENIGKKVRLENEAALKDQLFELQRDQYTRFVEEAESVKAMRHDMRHHLAVIGQLAEEENAGKIKSYVADVSGVVPPALEAKVCDNQTVNAVVAHYLSAAQKAGITVETSLDIPEDMKNVPVMDLCIVLGNLLENALEACRRVAPEETKFMKLSSRFRCGKLYLTVDNSFDGIVQYKNDIFYSRKHEGVGIGLSSVQATCKKYDGIARFDVRDTFFQASVMISLDGKRIVQRKERANRAHGSMKEN